MRVVEACRLSFPRQRPQKLFASFSRKRRPSLPRLARPLTNRYGLELRAAGPPDAPVIAELLAEAGLVVTPAILAERLDRVRRGAGAVLIALEWGPPSGLVALHWHPVLDADGPTAEITTLLVAAEARRRGIGRLLVKAAAQSARTAGCERLLVSTQGAGQDLAAFCRANGFAEGPLQFFRTLRKSR